MSYHFIKHLHPILYIPLYFIIILFFQLFFIILKHPNARTNSTLFICHCHCHPPLSSTTLKQQNQTHSPSTATPLSSNPKPMFDASSNNRLLSLSRNVVVPAPNEPSRKIEIYSLLLHHRYASNSKVSYDHGQFAWFLTRSFLISRRRSLAIHRSSHISSGPPIRSRSPARFADRSSPFCFGRETGRKKERERGERLAEK